MSFGWGPVEADGYRWYPVILPRLDSEGRLVALPARPLGFDDDLPVRGWIAADDGRTQYVQPLQPRCPSTVDLANVSGMLPAERLACFGEPIVLEGTYGCSGCGGVVAGEFKPAWLADPFGLHPLSTLTQFGPLGIRFAPDGPSAPTDGSIIRVTVHVDDHRATRCRVKEFDEAGELRSVPIESAIYACREELVVDSYVVLGTDPRFADP